MSDIIFSENIFMRYILPFLLVFTVTFAILQKTKVFGEGKRQIDVLVSLIMGLIMIGFTYATEIIVKLVPFLIVCLIILFILMVLYAFITPRDNGPIFHYGAQIALGIVFGIAVLGAVLWATGIWEKLYEFLFESDSSGKIFINILMLALIAGGVVAVVLGSGGKTKGS